MARGGSKRVPGKNVRPFLGMPMVAWPTLHAVESGLFTRVVISTDSPEIAKAAVEAGACFHGVRPAKLSDDHSTTSDVLKYELEQFKHREGRLPDACCCLYGTSFFTSPDLLRQGYAKLTGPCELVMGVCAYGHPIERALRLDEQGELHYRHPEYVSARTQDLSPSFHDTGLFYWFLPERFLLSGGESFQPLRKRGLVVPQNTAVDIDTEEDWGIAECIASVLQKREQSCL